MVTAQRQSDSAAARHDDGVRRLRRMDGIVLCVTNAQVVRRIRGVTAGRLAGTALVMIALSWVALMLVGHPVNSHGDQAGTHTAPMHHQMASAATASPVHDIGIWLWPVTWILMTIAMMGPATLPALHCLEQNSLRRGRSVALFAMMWLAVWGVAGVVVSLIRPVIPQHLGWWAFAAALAVAAVWQVTPFKRAALAGCEQVPAPASVGWSADRTALRFGAGVGTSCVGSCWAVMAAMVLAPGAHLLWMIPLTGAVTFERLSADPRRAAWWVAGLLAVCAAVVAVVAAV